jgi:hypothetical protein
VTETVWLSNKSWTGVNIIYISTLYLTFVMLPRTQRYNTTCGHEGRGHFLHCHCWDIAIEGTHLISHTHRDVTKFVHTE